MPNILIRGLDERVMKRLKARARRHGRSLPAEARRVLEQAAGADREEVAAMLDRWKRRFEGRRFADRAELIREDRQR